MTVAEYIFHFLESKGIKTVYMVSGSSAMWLTDALCRNEKIKAVCCHHEQAAAMAADGYGRVNDRPGACLVTIGPGAMNAITGVAQAFVDSSPLFIISGQTNSGLLKYEKETKIRQQGCQSLNLEPIVGTITKYFAEIMEPENIRYHMEKAYFEAMDGRKGPVWLDVPVDIQNRPVPDGMKGFAEESANEKEADVDYEMLAGLITKAEKPLVIAGYGVRSGKAVEELNRLSRECRIPVVTSRGGIDVIESDNPLFIGRPGNYGDRASHFALQRCDLLLILGSRLSVSTIGYYPARFAGNAVKIKVDIDQKELNKTDVPVDYKFRIGIKEFLQRLLLQLSGTKRTIREQWNLACLDMKRKYPNVLPEYKTHNPLNCYYFTKLLSEMTGENANIVVDTGSVCNIVSQSWELKSGQRYLISGGLSCMGFWASALGVCQENRMTIALTGDGSAQMNIQELATLRYNEIPVKLFIYNNNGYMLIRHNQHSYMRDRFLGVGPDSGLKTPDFIKVAWAYEVKAVRICHGDKLEEKIREVLAYQGPVVCEVMVEEFAEIMPKIASRVMPDGSLKAAEYDDLYPFIEKEEQSLEGAL